jgi:hypothetical protein
MIYFLRNRNKADLEFPSYTSSVSLGTPLFYDAMLLGRLRLFGFRPSIVQQFKGAPIGDLFWPSECARGLILLFTFK